MLTVDPIELGNPKAHHYLLGAVGPRPICFASTIDSAGNRNLAPFSFFNVFSSNPPVALFSPLLVSFSLLLISAPPRPLQLSSVLAAKF